MKGQLGGLILFGFDGVSPDDIPVDLVAQAAGVVLFRRNIQSAEQLRALTDAIRAVPRPERHPPIIAIDQEGGSVSRLTGIGTTIPSAMALGAADDETLTQAMYELTGNELAALGVNLDLAPVADLNDAATNPVVGTRSFGDNPARVSRHVQAAVRGLHGAGIGATVKHFPGHGGSVVDSHLDLPRIERSLKQLHEAEIVPFAGAIAQGVDCVMTAHVHLPELEHEVIPATLSPAVQGLLREELGFGGVIVTDCLEMQAVAARYDPAAAGCAALRAGADLLLFSHTTEAVPAVIQALENALNQLELQEELVSASLQRVGALGRRLATSMVGAMTLASVGGEAHQQAALDAARRAITCVRDPRGCVPLELGADDKILVVQFAGSPTSLVEDNTAPAPAPAAAQSAPARLRQSTAIGRALAAGPARVHEQVRTLDPAGHEYKQLLMAAGTSSAVVIVTSRAPQHPLQARVAADLLLIGKRVIAVASREPYDADALPQDLTVLASFGDDEHAMRAAAEVILGTAVARGGLPVRVASFTSQER